MIHFKDINGNYIGWAHENQSVPPEWIEITDTTERDNLIQAKQQEDLDRANLLAERKPVYDITELSAQMNAIKEHFKFK